VTDGDDRPCRAAAKRLAAAGAWLKLSGWYRPAPPPAARLAVVLRRAAALFGPRMVWGSDWPHTSFAAGHAPAYASLLAPLPSALGAASAAAALRRHPAILYSTTKEGATR
jgi:predicted TIM-barrel fold metal-dependent hydrolase